MRSPRSAIACGSGGKFGGSWIFIGLFLLVHVVWMVVKPGVRSRRSTRIPFILLNLMLSCIAALQAPIIMMSQNRQAAKDRPTRKLDYEVNVRAETADCGRAREVDVVREQEWAHGDCWRSSG